MSDDTGPLGDLPPADRTILLKAPMELAIIEVRLLNDGAELAHDTGLRLLEMLASTFPAFTKLDVAQQNSISVDFSPGALPSPQLQAGMRGWQLADERGLAQVTVLPHSVSVQLQGRAYERWSVSLRPLLEVTLEAVQEIMSPSVVGRIGLRYVDRFVNTDARNPGDWKGRIQDELLGPIRHITVGPLVRSAQQQLELSLGTSQGAIVRHGPFADPAESGATSYLLDIDVFDARPARLSVEEVATRAEVLNRTAASLFQQWMAPEYLHQLQGKSRDPAATGTTETALKAESL